MSTLTIWSLLAAGAMIGAAVGGAITLMLVRRNRGDETTVRSLQRDLAEYRSDVAAHYAETAKRVDALTHAYKDVYEHLEDGAYRLVGETELRRRLHDARNEPVTLEGIGRKALRDGGKEPASSTTAQDEDASHPHPPEAPEPSEATAPSEGDEGPTDPDTERPDRSST
ncbi:MAG: DUF1043 family protein [Trueperaceae bacterium]